MTGGWGHVYRKISISTDKIIISLHEINTDHNCSMFIRLSTYQLPRPVLRPIVLGHDATPSVSSLLRSILQRFR
jgi:hypothetical protein